MGGGDFPDRVFRALQDVKSEFGVILRGMIDVRPLNNYDIFCVMFSTGQELMLSYHMFCMDNSEVGTENNSIKTIVIYKPQTNHVLLTVTRDRMSMYHEAGGISISSKGPKLYKDGEIFDLPYTEAIMLREFVRSVFTKLYGAVE